MPELYTMRIAIAVATDLELAILQPGVASPEGLSRHHISCWTTGVGAMHTMYALTTRIREERPELVVQAGIGGAFDIVKHPLGSVVGIRRDCLADLGVREADGWRDVFDMGLASPSGFPYTGGWLVNPHDRLWECIGLKPATGVTVNRVSSDPDGIRELVQHLHPDVESMEGAALHFACLLSGVPFLQIRGISNRVGDRDKSTWHMGEALENTRMTLQRLILAIPENGPA
jgi:futalosine hydrolase